MKPYKVNHRTETHCYKAQSMFCPPSLGEEGFYCCGNCHKVIQRSEINFITEHIPTHIEVQKGIFRPIDPNP